MNPIGTAAAAVCGISLVYLLIQNGREAERQAWRNRHQRILDGHGRRLEQIGRRPRPVPIRFDDPGDPNAYCGIPNCGFPSANADSFVAC